MIGALGIGGNARTRLRVSVPSVVTPPSGATPDFTEDFSTYTSTADMISDPRGIYAAETESRTDDMVLDTSVGYGDLTQSLRYDYPTDADAIASGGAGTDRDYTIRRGLDLPASCQEVWIDAQCRFSSDFTIDGNGQPAGAALKWMHVRIPDGPGGRFDMGLNGGDADGQIPSNAPNDAPEMNVLPNPDFLVNPPDGTYNPGDLFDAQWHRVRYHIRLGATDFHEYWVDDDYYAQRSGTTAATALTIVTLCENLNKLAANAMELWWGKIDFYYAGNDPGWDTSNELVPA